MPQESKVIPVKVALRCRPLIDREVREGCQKCLQAVPGEPQVILGKDRAFTYDFAFGPTDPQAEVYEKACQCLIKSIFEGYNATILAYGQTGSGKTFTMGGCYEASLSGDEEDMGIIPRVLKDIFLGIHERDNSEFTVRVSYMEIYNEDLNDLLCPPNQRDAVVIREEINGGIKIQGLKETLVTSYDDIMRLLMEGSQGRTTAATAMNNTSSRSHAIFTLNIEQKKKDDMNDCSKVKFHMVDLAGSERCKRTQAEGERFKEGVNINKGLLALGNVISALGEEGQKRGHIPYRDSKLTRILQDSLGGNSHTLMIACVSPADSNIEETLNTLRYADRARKIKNKPIINRDPQAAEIMRLKTLVQELQAQLYPGSGINISSMKSEMSTSMSTICSTVSLNNSSEELQKLRETIKALEQENCELTKQLQRMTEQSTRMLEQVIKLETNNEKLKLRIGHVKDYVGVDLELLSTSVDVERNPQLKAELDKLHRIANSFKEEGVGDEEDENDETKQEEPEEENNQMDEEVMSTPSSRAIAQKHALRQAELHHELNEINRILSSKQALAEKMIKTDDEMENFRKRHEEMMQEWKTKTEQLEREKEELTHTLHDARVSANASKVSEQRRKRLHELEQQMSVLKKKMADQNRIVKSKEQSDKTVSKLNRDIQALKQQRVRLMKQMKEEMVNFAKWKKEKDKEVMKLQQKDRKREFEVQRMKKEFENQQSVQKRKTAEAIAANKRLREALQKQKEVESERSGKLEKYDATSIGNRVRKWLSRELDVKVSMREAQYHLAELMEDRKLLTERLQDLREQLEEGPLSEKFSWLGNNGDKDEISFQEKEIKKQMTSIELDIESINANIQELQQKIVDADQDSKGKSTWQTLHTMNEAKCALKFLLDQAISAKVDMTKVNGELRHVQDRGKEEEETIKELKSEISRMKSQFETEKHKLIETYEEKTLFLLNADQALNADSRKNERTKILESKVAKLQDVKKDLEEKQKDMEKVKQENEMLKAELGVLNRTHNRTRLMPDLDVRSPIPDPPVRQDNLSSSLNSTFVVDEEELKPPQQLPKKRASRNKKEHLDSQENISLSSSDGENNSSKTRASRPRKASRKTYVKASSDETMDTAEDSVSVSFLKRRSGEDASEMDTSEERKKKRKRTLHPNETNRFFEPLN